MRLRVDSELEFSVTDDGVGISEPKKDGIGSRIVELLARQLGATLTREPSDPGLRVTLRMPKPQI